MRTKQCLVLNLIGISRDIIKASTEITNYSKNKYNISIINTNKLETTLKNEYLNKELFINKCGLINDDELKNIHHYIRYNYSHYDIYSYALLITNNNHNSSSIINDSYIHNTYNIDSSVEEKNDLIENILLENYSKFKFNTRYF